MTIEIQTRFDEPHILQWENPKDKFGTPAIVDPDIIEGIHTFQRTSEPQKIPLTLGGNPLILKIEFHEWGDNDPLIVQLLEGSTSLALCGADDTYSEPLHYGELVEAEYRKMGLNTLMRTVLECVRGVLLYEITKKTDRLLFLLRRGYIPSHSIPEAGQRFTQAEDQLLDESQRKALFQKAQITFRTRQSEPLDHWIRMTRSPLAAQALWEQLQANQFL
ncbi:MAG TPA: hypothetical protein VIT68_03125 [Candidatus Gracilibacteria bacterium]